MEILATLRESFVIRVYHKVDDDDDDSPVTCVTVPPCILIVFCIHVRLSVRIFIFITQKRKIVYLIVSIPKMKIIPRVI